MPPLLGHEAVKHYPCLKRQPRLSSSSSSSSFRSHFGSSRLGGPAPARSEGNGGVPPHVGGSVRWQLFMRSIFVLFLTAIVVFSDGLLDFGGVAHARSALKQAERRALALERGFIQSAPMGHKFVLTPKVVAHRVQSQVPALAEHRRLVVESGKPWHFGAAAVEIHAGPDERPARQQSSPTLSTRCPRSTSLGRRS